MSSAENRRPRPGRPRHIQAPDSVLSARDQILDAAARLFVYQGFAATSTREIADRVGIRQASLYYHFASGKDEILGELLQQSVRPTVDKVAQIDGMCPPEAPETALYVLMLLDVRTLAALPHNTGFLARLPEVTRSPAYEPYDKTRRGLEDAYERLGRQVVGSHVVVPGTTGGVAAQPCGDRDPDEEVRRQDRRSGGVRYRSLWAADVRSHSRADRHCGATGSTSHRRPMTTRTLDEPGHPYRRPPSPEAQRVGPARWLP